MEIYLHFYIATQKTNTYIHKSLLFPVEIEHYILATLIVYLNYEPSQYAGLPEAT